MEKLRLPKAEVPKWTRAIDLGGCVAPDLELRVHNTLGKVEVGTSRTPKAQSPEVDLDRWLRRRMRTVDLVPVESSKVAKRQEVKPRVTAQVTCKKELVEGASTHGHWDLEKVLRKKEPRG
jgi:hypothetical protein